MNCRSAIVTLVGAVLASQAASRGQEPPRRVSIPPDVANASYGLHERNVLDLWKAKSARPTPLIIFIHGGGFTGGDKRLLSAALLDTALKGGISVASINYRYSTQAPYPAPMADSARAVQFLRQHASEWNLNPRAFGATGSSAGAGISLWIGFHNDMADPKSSDPVKRQSTRLSAIAVMQAQTSYDPRTIAKVVNPETGRINALRLLFDVKEGDSLEATEAFPRYEDGSPVTHLTRDDPPVLLIYSGADADVPPGQSDIHHPRFGYFLKEKMDKLGIECVVRTRDDYQGQPPSKQQQDIVEYFRVHFLKQ